MNYKFTYDDNVYELNESNFSDLINDEEIPVKGITRENILNLLSEYEDVNFELAYFDQACQKCFAGREEKAKYFKFLEYYFYIFTKNGDYVISSIDKEYENTSYNKLLKEKKVDNSYIVSVLVCANCKEYSIVIEQCEV
jgi:hypothetical protein